MNQCRNTIIFFFTVSLQKFNTLEYDCTKENDYLCPVGGNAILLARASVAESLNLEIAKIQL